MTYFDEVHAAKETRDVVRSRLVMALKAVSETLPVEIQNLLAEDEITTNEFHARFQQYRIDRALMEAQPINVVRKVA